MTKKKKKSPFSIHTVSLGQEFGSSYLAGWFWLEVCHKDGSQAIGQGCSDLKTELGLEDKPPRKLFIWMVGWCSLWGRGLRVAWGSLWHGRLFLSEQMIQMRTREKSNIFCNSALGVPLLLLQHPIDYIGQPFSVLGWATQNCEYEEERIIGTILEATWW